MVKNIVQDRQKRVTSQQVAKLAGVSRTTVSFVLNDAPGANISQETRTRVLKAAEELGYVPNAAAQMLVSGETRTIGLVVAQAEHLQVDAFIPQLLYSLCHSSHALGYRVLLETVEDVTRPDAYDELVSGRRIDGLIVLNTRSDDTQLPALIARDFPVVLVGYPGWADLGARSASVGTDGRDAGRRITAHLISLGHERIAHVTFSPAQYHATQDRYLGYRSALEAAGLKIDPRLVEYANYSARSGYDAMQRLLKRKPQPTAVFAGNDTVALGAMAAIHERGLRIPEDIAVVGFDDTPTAAFTIPPLTTVRVSAVEQGELGVQILTKLLQGQVPVQRHVTVETPLVIRQSCGASSK